MAFIKRLAPPEIVSHKLSVIHELTYANDVIALAQELDGAADHIDDPELYRYYLDSTLELLNKGATAKKVAGANKLLLHAEQGFAIDSEEEDLDFIELEFGRVVDIYCKAQLRDMVWLADVALNGYAARMVDVHLYEPDNELPQQLNHSLVIPVRDIHSYLVAA